MSLNDATKKAMKQLLVIGINRLRKGQFDRTKFFTRQPVLREFSGTYLWQEESVLNGFSLCESLAQSLEEDVSVKELFSRVLEDPLLSPILNRRVGTDIEYQRLTPAVLLSGILRQYINRFTYEGEVNQSGLNEIIDQIEKILVNKEVIVKFCGTLEDVDINDRDIEVSRGVYIRKQPKEQIVELINNHAEYRQYYLEGSHQTYPFHFLTSKVEANFKVAFSEHSEESRLALVEQGQNILSAVVKSLRLLNVNTARVGLVTIFTNLPWQREQVMMFSPMRNFQPRYGLNLSVDVVSDLQNYYKLCLDTSGISESINIALNRIGNSGDRLSIEDQLIDLVIALEAFALDKDEKDGIKYRLAIRTAKLLGTTNEDTREYFSLVSRAYKLRSNVVHGNKVIEPQDVHLINKFGDLVRQVAKKLSFNETSINWDDLVLKT